MTERCSQKTSRKWEALKFWSPPLHYDMNVTAPTYLHPIPKTDDVSSLPSGTSTPTTYTNSLTTSTLSILPTHKTTTITITQTPPTLWSRIKTKLKFDSLLDIVTLLAGSRFIFLLTLALLVLWVILGIVFGTSEVWQIIMQNGSSIQCYVSDTLLMRQQQNSCVEFLSAIGDLLSRNRSLSRMLKSLAPGQRETLRLALEKEGLPSFSSASDLEKRKETKGRSHITTLFDKTCDHVATATGSLPSVIFYTIGIFIWLGLGKIYNFSNLWQLYINTAVAVSLTFTSMFLQNIRRRHSDSLNHTLTNISSLSISLETHLRSLTDDEIPNESYTIETPPPTKKEKFIDGYAYIVGSGVGVLISLIVLTVWIALGHLLSWNSNWWLIIGTYTGLVGFIDGFVLRNVYFRQTQLLNTYLHTLSQSDSDLFALLNLSHQSSSSSLKETQRSKSLSYKISNWTITICSLPWAVIGSLFVVAILLGIATGLRWSETGQLLCNTPTMIVEGLLLLVLFQAHNMSNVRRIEEFWDVEGRRRRLRGGLVLLGGEGEEREVEMEMEREKGSVSVSVVSLVVEEKC